MSAAQHVYDLICFVDRPDRNFYFVCFVFDLKTHKAFLQFAKSAYLLVVFVKLL